MRALTPVLLGVALTACATTRYYQDPTEDLDAYAKITIRNVSIRGFAARLYQDSLTCTAPVLLTHDIREIKTNETRTFRARKGEPVTIGAWYVTFSGQKKTQCDLNTTFVPTAASYEVVYDADQRLENCSVGILEDGGAEPRPLPKDSFVVRAFHLAFAGEGPWCKALTDEHRAKLGIAQQGAK